MRIFFLEFREYENSLLNFSNRIGIYILIFFFEYFFLSGSIREGDGIVNGLENREIFILILFLFNSRIFMQDGYGLGIISL